MLLIAVVIIIAGALAIQSPVGAQQLDDPIEGSVPTQGVALLVTRSAVTPSALVDALDGRGCVATSLAVTMDGAWRTYVPGAPEFVNGQFVSTLSAGMLAANTPFAVRCSGDPATAGTGFLLQAAHGLGTGGFATQTDVRVGKHEAYDRIVLEFAEDVIPAYDIEYVTEPQYTCGQGSPVSVEGTVTLRVRLSGARINDDAGEMTIPSRSLMPGLPGIREAREICAFEGEVTWLVGLDVDREFRLFLLQEPGRIVIDIAHTDCADCATPGGSGGMAGVVFAGPMCPVEQAGVNCPDRLADVTFEVQTPTSTVASVDTGADGQYLVPLDAGDYQVVFPAGGPPSGVTQDVSVPAAAWEWVELRVDTGIR
jgi:hypothetical protein